MSFREKEILIRYLFRLHNRKTAISVLRDGDNDVYLDSIRQALSCLPDNLRSIITNEFINNLPPGWWTLDYSKSSFYRLKNRAMQMFLDCLKW